MMASAKTSTSNVVFTFLKILLISRKRFCMYYVVLMLFGSIVADTEY
jgi:hypothetical protein